MSYKVYTAEYISLNRNHVRIFVETESDGGGLIFHVIGNILAGMDYEKKPGSRPDESMGSVDGSLVLIGNLEKSRLPEFESACESVPVPGAQLLLNGKPKDPSKPVRRCGDWIQDVKAKVIADGILGG